MNKIICKDLYAFHPGYYLSEIIDDMGITQVEFATRLGTTPKTLSQLINGQIDLSNEIADKLSVMLGTGIDVWLKLQTAYEKKKEVMVKLKLCLRLIIRLFHRTKISIPQCLPGFFER